MSKVFRSRFVIGLKEVLPDQIDKKLICELYKKDWVIYAASGRYQKVRSLLATRITAKAGKAKK